MEFFAYTDGACSGNPGPGGWGVLLIAQDAQGVQKEKELCGGAEATTNNQMELMAAIMALESLARPTEITVLTDSVYVKDGITRWITGWKARGWKRKGNVPVKNLELWQRLDLAATHHKVTWRWVKGHADTQGNIRADALARKGMADFQLA